MNCYSLLSLILSVPLLLGTPLSAGVVHTIETTKARSAKVISSTTISIEGDNFKIETNEGGKSQSTLIFKGESKEIIIVDHYQNSYFIMDQETIEGLASQLNNAMAQMKTMMANVSPEQKAMMEKMMKQGMGSIPGIPTDSQMQIKPVIKKTGASKTINGYSTQQVVKLENGKRIHEFWVTNWKSVEGGKETLYALEAMQAFMSKIFDSISSENSDPFASTLQNMKGNFMEDVTDLGGFPVSTVDYKNGRSETKSTLTSSTSANLSTANFNVPSSYKRRSMTGQ